MEASLFASARGSSRRLTPGRLPSLVVFAGPLSPPLGIFQEDCGEQPQLVPRQGPLARQVKSRWLAHLIPLGLRNLPSCFHPCLVLLCSVRFLSPLVPNSRGSAPFIRPRRCGTWDLRCGIRPALSPLCSGGPVKGRPVMGQ